MNGQEQRERATAVTQLWKKLAEVEQDTLDAFGTEVDARIQAIADLREEMRKMFAVEHSWALSQAEAQRSYTDRADRDNYDALLRFRYLPWWKRVCWALFKGQGF